MQYSMTMGGILLSAVGVIVAQFGFSEACGSELTAKLVDLLLPLPGLLMAWWGRMRMGGVTILGVKTD